MKNIYVVVLAAALLIMPVSYTFASQADVDKSIAEVKKLYTQALVMEMNNIERAELLSEAEDILQHTIRNNPNSLEAHRKLVGVHVLQQDYTRGIRVMQRAINLSPKDPQLFVALATFYQKTGALDLSKEMLNQALILDPNHKIAKDYKVVIQKALDDFDRTENQKPMDAVHGNVAPAHSIK